MASLTDRMIRAAKLDVHLYEEVEADKDAMGQAAIVVVLSSLAAGIGSYQMVGSIGGLISATIGALIGWAIWAFITYIIGTKLLPEPQTQADWGELLRTIGFSSSPGLIRVLGIIPIIGGIFLLIASIWMLIAMVIAVRQALDYHSTLRAVGVCLIGWIVQVVILGVLLAPFMK
ncbi:MAG: YIP1 family protein [Candidatus Omnitrophica bacterium]|nr:YIP1 family protein [Candidatus Omnitrophota bacterium]